MGDTRRIQCHFQVNCLGSPPDRTFCKATKRVSITKTLALLLVLSMASTQSDTENSGEAEVYNCFFYGTLLHPKVLKRVICNQGDHLVISPAILEGYVRHKVEWADFPAIISAQKSHEFFNTTPNAQDDRVRGSFVSGLTVRDMKFLERFESNLYDCVPVEVYLLQDPVALNDVELDALVDPALKPMSAISHLSVPALTFVWGEETEELLQDHWSFEDFVEQKLHLWA